MTAKTATKAQAQEAPQKEAPQEAPKTTHIGAHDLQVKEAMLDLLEDSPQGITVKQVAQVTGLRVRVLENTCWRLSDQGGKYLPPFFTRDNSKRPVTFTIYQEPEPETSQEA